MLILTVLYALADCPDYCFLSSLHKTNIVIQMIVVIATAVVFISSPLYGLVSTSIRLSV